MTLPEYASNTEIPVVRLVITQARSLEDIGAAIETCKGFDDIYKLEFTQSYWGIKAGNAVNPWQVMAIGGKISEKDEREVRRLVRENSLAADEQTCIQTVRRIAACREALDEIDLQGISFDDIDDLLTGQSPRLYSFTYPKQKEPLKRKEYWMTLRAPNDFLPYLFNQDDKLSQVVGLTPAQVRKMFENDRLVLNHQPFPLVDNLVSNEEKRVEAKVNTKQEDVEQIRDAIITRVETEDRGFKILLAEKMMIYAQNHPLYGKAENRVDYQKTLDSMTRVISDRTTFETAYTDFLKTYWDNIPAAGTRKEAKDTRLQQFKQAISQAWHRVLFQEFTNYTALVPVQGELLAAVLPIDNATSDELESLETAGPEKWRKLSQFINRALMPQHALTNITLDPKYDNLKSTANPSLTYKPLTAEERYKRLEQYRYLKVHEADGSLSADEIILLTAWEDEMYEILQTTTGVTKTEFAEFSTDYNLMFEHIRQNIATKVATIASAPTLLARHPDTSVTQLGEWLLMMHGYSQYIDTAQRGEVISPKAIVDMRLKFAAMLWDVEAKRYYEKAVNQTTFFWRRVLFQLVGDSSGEPYVIYREPKQAKVKIVTTEKAGNILGVDVLLKRTGLNYQVSYQTKPDPITITIPINIFEKTVDKEFESVKRKMWERGWNPERIKDVYRTALTIDTKSDEVVSKLKEAHTIYKSIPHKEEPILDYDEWVTQLSKEIIRNRLLPAIQSQADKDHYTYEMDQFKDRLDEDEPTGGSAASEAFIWCKFYANMNLTHPLAKAAETIEVEVFATPEEMFRKETDQYPVKRYTTTKPGLIRSRTLFNAFYPDPYYSRAYKYLGRLEQGQHVQKGKLRQKLEAIFGPVRAVIFEQKH